MKRELIKSVELNLLRLTDVKKDKLNKLYSAWQSACSTLFDCLKYWDGFAYDIPVTSVNLHRLTYKGMKTDTGLPSNILETVRNEVLRKVSNPIIRFNNKTFLFKQTKRRNPIFVVSGMEKGKRIALPIKQDGSFKRFNKFKNDGWTFSSILLKRKFFVIHVIFKKTITVKEPKEFKNIVAVDIGSTNLAAVVVYSPKEKRVIRSFYLGRDVAPRQRVFERRRAKLQSRGKIKLGNDQRNFTITRVYQIAHQVVNIAKEYNGYLVVEDLDGFTDIHYTVKSNRKIHRIPTRLGEVIGRVGIENGVPMLVVNPAYTSQDCPKCGNRHKTTEREYHCPKCGRTVNRDINAGENIALRAVNHVLQQNVQAWLNR